MMRVKLVYIFFLLFTCGFFAQNVDAIFDEANKAYRNSSYQEALNGYHQIDSLGLQSSDLFYNIGNTYYKLNQIAPSIYYYEKALLLDPNNEDAKQNLTFAQRMTIDAFEALPKSVFQKINDRIIYPIHYNTWAWISIFLAFMVGVFFLLYYFSFNTNKKRLFFTVSLVSVGLFLISMSFVIKAKHFSDHTKPAIVFSSKVSVKSEPNTNADEAFELHEGTKIHVVETIDDWNKIKLMDGKTGWIKSESFKRIK